MQTIGTLKEVIEYTNNRLETIYCQIPLEERLKTPHEGDLIDWGDNYGRFDFPNNPNTFGRIDEIHDDFIHCCINEGSAYLGTPQKIESTIGFLETHMRKGDAVFKMPSYVSISGGPFKYIPSNTFEFSQIIYTPFWNFKDHHWSAGNGYRFKIPRPLWRINRIIMSYQQEKEKLNATRL
jgi:hypothetical protein